MRKFIPSIFITITYPSQQLYKTMLDYFVIYYIITQEIS